MTSEGSLRERKKLRAMRRIQSVALDLFDELGFENVTIEQIAATAEVSPSSVYRYFGTKEGVVLWDEGDIEFIEAVRAEMVDHTPVESVRRAMARVLTQYFESNEAHARRLTRILFEEPALRAAQLEQMNGFTEMVAVSLAQASGREADQPRGAGSGGGARRGTDGCCSPLVRLRLHHVSAGRDGTRPRCGRKRPEARLISVSYWCVVGTARWSTARSRPARRGTISTTQSGRAPGATPDSTAALSGCRRALGLRRRSR